MKKKLTAKTKAILALALVLAAVVTIVGALTLATPPGENVVQTILSPFRTAANAIVRQAERYYNYIFQYEALEADNEALRARVMQMEDEIRTADELQRENERLRQLLNLTKEHEDYELVSAYIVAWEESNWKSTFTIGKGTNSGIEVGLVAITEYGQVVGLVTDVGPNWATVTTVLDSASEISATVASTGYNGIVEGAYATGQEGLLRMSYLPTDSVLRNNDQVLTTGSTVYPRRLIIGYIVDADIDETGVAKYAILQPAAGRGPWPLGDRVTSVPSLISDAPKLAPVTVMFPAALSTYA